MIRIGIVGCGAIGSSLGKKIVTDFSGKARLSALYDVDRDKALALARKAGRPSLCVADLDALLKRVDLVVEAASAKVSLDICRRALRAGRDCLVLSVGGIVPHLAGLSKSAAAHHARVYIPSGAVSGIDALSAARQGKLTRVVLTTRKNPVSFRGVRYVEDMKIDLKSIKQDTVIFDGTAEQAVKYFPQNINVAGILSMAGLGPKKTRVRIIASPSVSRNIHEISIESSAGTIFTRTENVLHPDNPKTSYLAVLAALATISRIVDPVKIGT